MSQIMLQATATEKQVNAEPLPGYRLLHRLGKGGFAEVWKSEAPGGFVKAIKFVYGNLDGIGDQGAQAAQELRALDWVKVVRHPFILSIERVEIVGGELVIVMELADKNLEERLNECQALGSPGIPRAELLAYLRDAAEALDLMNFQYDLQHLDIKPRNLFLIGNRLKVADFGLVQCIEELSLGNSQGELPGEFTPTYAAPELFQGSISRHSDQYSLAVTYQELLTGTRPYRGTNPRQLALQLLGEKPDLSAIAENERAVLARALAKDPQDRFPSCLAFMRALLAVQSPCSPVAELPFTSDPSSLTPMPPMVRLTDTMEDFFLSTVVPRGSKPDMELPPSRLHELLNEIDTLRRQLADSEAELRRIEESARAQQQELADRYESLLGNKFQGLVENSRCEDLKASIADESVKREQLLAVAQELERQRVQLRREEKELQTQIRNEEVRLCKERAELSRQQADLQRHHAKVSSSPILAPSPTSAPAPNDQVLHEIEEAREQLKSDEEGLKDQIEQFERQVAHERSELARQKTECEKRLRELNQQKVDWETRQREMQNKINKMSETESALAQKLAPLAKLKETLDQLLNAAPTPPTS